MSSMPDISAAIVVATVAATAALAGVVLATRLLWTFGQRVAMWRRASRVLGGDWWPRFERDLRRFEAQHHHRPGR
jgi:hypothetical protein